MSSGRSWDHSESVSRELELEEMHPLPAEREVGEKLILLPISSWKLLSAIAEPGVKSIDTDPGKETACRDQPLSRPLRFRAEQGALAPRVQKPALGLLPPWKIRKPQDEGRRPGSWKENGLSLCQACVKCRQSSTPVGVLPGTAVLTETLIPK